MTLSTLQEKLLRARSRARGVNGIVENARKQNTREAEAPICTQTRAEGISEVERLFLHYDQLCPKH